MKRRGNKRQYIGVICLAMVISLSAVGVGFGAWQEGMQVRGVVATGNIDPVFSRCVVAGESCSPGRAMASLEGDGNGKRLGLQVHDAYPGYNVRVRYWVKNEGTVPVSYKTETVNFDPGVTVTLTNPTGVIDRGEEGEGDLEIQVGSVEEDKEYDFTVDLVFKQWNAVD